MSLYGGVEVGEYVHHVVVQSLQFSHIVIMYGAGEAGVPHSPEVGVPRQP